MSGYLKAELAQIDELVRAEKYSIALDRVEELTAQHPQEASIWRTRAYVNAHQGNTEDAIEDVSKAIEICDEEPDFYYTRGILFFRTARYQQAISDFTAVIKLCDCHGSDYYREGAHFFRADAYLRLNEFTKAREDCGYVRDGFQTWTDSLVSKDAILEKCGRQ
jgi:tetratricopeptide (TPR) repeat protein